MKKRNPFAVFLLPIVTFGIYSLYWFVKTKGEMNERGAKIPTSWLIIIPFANIWWLWKYSEGVEMVTGNKLNGVLTFLLLWLLGWIGCAIVQDSFNNNVVAAAQTDQGVTPPEATTPDAVETTEISQTTPEASTEQTVQATQTTAEEASDNITPTTPTPTA